MQTSRKKITDHESKSTLNLFMIYDFLNSRSVLKTNRQIKDEQENIIDNLKLNLTQFAFI